MRDPSRIDGVLEALEERWRSAPDLRLAQIIGNAGQAMGYRTDPYYMEDYELMEYLKSWEDEDDMR